MFLFAVYCYGFSLNNKFIPFIQSKLNVLVPHLILIYNFHFEFYLDPQSPPSPTNVGFYNRSYSSDQSNRSQSLGLNRSLKRMQ